ncbi:hypothetical protein Syun_004191 [Stephania yunnanensis]|uniref:Uncharacterized protein n=1 Tax=Stephania yunnanensis TaxID=152371 RepID=A0AAP0L6Q1_9MAGN
MFDNMRNVFNTMIGSYEDMFAKDLFHNYQIMDDRVRGVEQNIAEHRTPPRILLERHKDHSENGGKKIELKPGFLMEHDDSPNQDGPAYFPVVAIMSLGSPAVMKFSPHSRFGEYNGMSTNSSTVVNDTSENAESTENKTGLCSDQHDVDKNLIHNCLCCGHITYMTLRIAMSPIRQGMYICSGVVTVEGITYVLDVPASLFVEEIIVVQDSIFV